MDNTINELRRIKDVMTSYLNADKDGYVRVSVRTNVLRMNILTLGRAITRLEETEEEIE